MTDEIFVIRSTFGRLLKEGTRECLWQHWLNLRDLGGIPFEGGVVPHVSFYVVVNSVSSQRKYVPNYVGNIFLYFLTMTLPLA